MQLPAPPEDGDTDTEGRRLWIGNIDDKITEFALLKLLQKYGPLEKFDFLYHKSGPDQGKPRGYCFVTYKDIKDADKAQRALDGKKALTRRLVVKLAHAEKADLPVQPQSTSLLDRSTKPVSTSTKSRIEAIESQLKQLEKAKFTDINAFLPADKKPPEENPLIHCIAGRNQSQQVQTNNRHHISSHNSGQRSNNRSSSRDQRSYNRDQRSYNRDQRSYNKDRNNRDKRPYSKHKH